MAPGHKTRAGFKVIESPGKPVLKEILEPVYTRKEVKAHFNFTNYQVKTYLGSHQFYPLSRLVEFVKAWNKRFRVPAIRPPLETSQMTGEEIRAYVKRRIEVHSERMREGLE